MSLKPKLYKLRFDFGKTKVALMSIPASHGNKSKLRRLRRATKVAAKLVDLYGDAYWPIFDRMESELRSIEMREQKLSRFK